MPSGGKRTPATLKWLPHEYYTYNLLKNKDLTIKDMEREYNRLRSVANQRLTRLGQSEFKGVEAYKLNKGQYLKPASSYKTKAQLAKKLYQVSRFITAEGGSVRGQQRIRRRTVSSLHEAGFTFINNKNIEAFGNFMEEMRSRAGGRLLDSDRVAEVFGIARNLGVTSKTLERDFDLWLANSKQLEKLKPLKGKHHDSATYLNKLKRVWEPQKYEYSKNAKDLLGKMSKTANKQVVKEIKNKLNKDVIKTEDIDTDDYFD